MGGLDGEDDVLLVQHAIVLETVQQRGRRAFRIAGEKHRRSGHALRWLALEHAHQIVERGLEPAGLVEQKPRAAPPRIHHEHDDDAERERHPAAFDDLEHVGRQKGQVDHQERQDQGRRRQDRPSPYAPDDDKGHHAGHHHSAGDGNAVGRGERAR